MKITFYFSFILFLVLSSCQEKQEVTRDPREATDTLQINFQSYKKQEIVLTPSAQSATEGWENYPELAAQIKALDTVRVGYLRANGKDWISNASLAQTKVKDSFANTAIESRLTVLFTKTNTLIQEASKLEVDTASVNKEATELYNTFQNLKLQINLKHQKSIEELLEQYEIEADSLSAVKDAAQTSRDSLLRANNVPVQN